jgi:uncharacterized protein
LGPGEPAIPGDPVPLDVAAVTAEFGAALHGAGVPADPGRCARFARAVSVMRPRTLRELHACGLATLVSGPEQIEVYDRIFAAAFGARWPEPRPGDSLPPVTGTAPRPDGSPPDPAGGRVARPVNAARLDLRSGDGEPPERDGNLPWRTVATAAERLSSRDFADLSETEQRRLEDLMRRRVIATGASQTGASQRRPSPTGTSRTEVFTFATRLTRITAELATARPETVLARAGAAAPKVSGMAAAWPYCDAVVSAHSLDAISDLIAALAQPA